MDGVKKDGKRIDRLGLRESSEPRPERRAKDPMNSRKSQCVKHIKRVKASGDERGDFGDHLAPNS